MTRHKPHKPKLRSLYQWHRWLGLAVALIALLLALTGLLLNHTEALALKQRPVEARWLLGWYGISAPQGRFYAVGERWISQWEERLFLDETALGHADGPLIGAVRTPQFIITATTSELRLFTAEGQLVERLGAAEGLPPDIDAIAVRTAGTLLLRTPQGTFAGDEELTRWQAVETTTQWSRLAGAPPSALRQSLERQHLGGGLPLERVILDLHSGRLFGQWGVYVVDISAVLLIFNAASGVLIWWRRRRNEQQRTRHTSA